MEIDNNKYYTPSIDEFYIGFECEIYNANNEWLPILFTKGHLYNDLKFVDQFEDNLENSFRVKYLSKEDIEGLGWVWNTDRYEHGNNGWGADLELLQDKSVCINRVIYKINNKSELKVLMKQLGING